MLWRGPTPPPTGLVGRPERKTPRPRSARQGGGRYNEAPALYWGNSGGRPQSHARAGPRRRPPLTRPPPPPARPARALSVGPASERPLTRAPKRKGGTSR